jgi:putative transcriptional regulator
MNNDIMKILAGVTEVPEFGPAAVTGLMSRYKLNEKGFAVLMNVTPMTVKLWISGAVRPCGQSRRLMQIYEACPKILDKVVGYEPDNEEF